MHRARLIFSILAALVGAISLGVSIYIAIGPASLELKLPFALGLLALSAAAFVISFLLARFFYPPGYVISAGVALIFLMPSLQGWLAAALVAYFGESSRKKAIAQGIVDFTAQMSRLSEIDWTCLIGGLAMISVGVFWATRPVIQIEESFPDRLFKVKIGRDATPEQIDAALRRDRSEPEESPQDE